MHRSICRSSFLVPILALSAGGLLLSTVAAADSIEVTERLLTLVGASDLNPAMSGDITVFTSNRLDSSDILMIDEFQEVLPVHVGPGEQRASDIDGMTVVYVDTTAGDTNIAMTDLSTGTQQLITFSGAQDTAPAISGSNVVFISSRLGGEDILRIDLVSLDIELVATGPGAEIKPTIDGNLIAWQVFENGSINVYGQEIGDTTFPIATGTGDESDASVSGHLVAYIVDGDVAVYDHSTGQTTQITNDAFVQSKVVIDGQRLVWVDDRNGNDDIFLHDLVSGETFQLTTDPSDQYLGDFEGNRVVFFDLRLGNSNVWQVEFTIIPDVPTLSFLGMALLAGLLVGVGAWLLRRQRVLSS